MNVFRKFYRGVRRAVLSLKEQSIWFFRLATSNFRVLPDFIVIGAMKSGTTSLFYYLGQHPEIKSSYKKEIHFFDRNFDKTTNWYRAHFPLLLTRRKTFVTGEATPSYMLYPPVAQRIHEVNPNVKIIAILRDPVDRAISHFYHEVARKREPHDIETALSLEPTRIHSGKTNIQIPDESYLHFTYKERGRYCEQLLRYKNLFGTENILLLDFEDLKVNPNQVVHKVLQFLEINTNFRLRDRGVINRGIEKDITKKNIRRDLEEYFRLPNKQLFREFDFHRIWSEQLESEIQSKKQGVPRWKK